MNISLELSPSAYVHVLSLGLLSRMQTAFRGIIRPVYLLFIYLFTLLLSDGCCLHLYTYHS